MNNKIYTGFIPPPNGIEPEHWVLGASNTPPFPAIKEDGDWELQIPIVEKQNKGNFETFNCTGFNTLNAIEILMAYKFGGTFNYSDRWLGIIAGTKPPGNDPQTVAEAIRKYGLIPDEMLPFSDDLQNVEEYYSFKGLTQSQIDACYAEGKKWLEQYEFRHAWVYKEQQPFDEKLNNMKVGLKSSPLAIGVFAWASDERDVYISKGMLNHWTGVYGANNFIKVIDTYEPFKKMVEQDITYCKMFYIEKKDGGLTESQVKGFWAQIKAIWSIVFNIQKQVDTLPKAPIRPVVESKPDNTYNEVKEALKPIKVTTSQKVYDTAYSLLGQYLTMNTSVPKNLNCAQAVSYVLNKAGLPIPKGGISGTIMLNEWLKTNCYLVSEPTVGDIIISITQGENHGHVGVVGKNSIMSNDSPTGLFKPYYTLKSWTEFYVNTKKLKTLYYRFK